MTEKLLTGTLSLNTSNQPTEKLMESPGSVIIKSESIPDSVFVYKSISMKGSLRERPLLSN